MIARTGRRAGDIGQRLSEPLARVGRSGCRSHRQEPAGDVAQRDRAAGAHPIP
jgi:hypothetical protein